MKNKAKLAFEMLENEIELIKNEEMGGFVGGSAYTFGSIVININKSGYDTISFDGGCTTSVMLQEVRCVDDAYTGNWMENYIGPNNPSGYDNSPANMADLFAMVHDIQYDNIGAAGVNSVLFDMRTLGADLTLITNETQVASGYYGNHPIPRLEGLAISIGIRATVLFKILANPTFR